MYGGVGYSAWWEAPPKIGGCSRCARPAGTLAAEKYVLAGGAGQNMIPFSFPACGRGNSARRALPGESMGRKGAGYPTGDFPPPKPSPWGEGAPVRTLGRMRGRPCTQPFLVGVENGGSHLSPQRNFSPAPLGNPVAPSSVTFGDSFPPRGSLWVVLPHTKKRPKSGYADGHRNSPTTGTMRHPTPKRASGNERPLNPGGAGGHPPRLFASGLSLEKAWIPRPGPGGKPPRRC